MIPIGFAPRLPRGRAVSAAAFAALVACGSYAVAEPEKTADDDAAVQTASVSDAAAPDPLAGTPRIDPATTGGDAERSLATMLPPRTDAPTDWHASLEPLHDCGEPRALPPCVPPPPCHPADPPSPYDLIGAGGVPSCGPIYRGPCAPRSAAAHEGPFRWLHALRDRLFDLFYRAR